MHPSLPTAYCIVVTGLTIAQCGTTTLQVQRMVGTLGTMHDLYTGYIAVKWVQCSSAQWPLQSTALSVFQSLST